MARPLRLEFPGALYHITARGDRKEPIFLDDSDRLLFIDFLAKEVRQQRWILYAFCLMDNHYHLLLETPEPNLVGGIRRLNGAYTQAFNRRHDLVGHLLQGRYKSILVDKQSYLLELCRYVVLNPVRAGSVARAEDWPWSSYLPTVGKMTCPDWLSANRVLGLFNETPGRARSAYAKFVKRGLGASSPWAQVSGQIYLGSQGFLEEVQRRVGSKPSRNVARSHLQPLRPTADQILESISNEYGLTRKALLERTQPDAFKLAVYRLRREANLPLNEVSRIAGISVPRISQIQTELEAGDKRPARRSTYKLKN
jgi:putative transposase